MSVADKYMNQANKKNFKFEPPKFNKNLFRNNENSMKNEFINYNNNKGEIKLYPIESSEAQLYCYYNEIEGCYKGNGDNVKQNMVNSDGRIKVEIPSPSEMLRNFDLEIDEEIDFNDSREKTDVDNIYSRIESENPNVLGTLLNYNIPSPLAKLITKRIVQLSLKYQVRE